MSARPKKCGLAWFALIGTIALSACGGTKSTVVSNTIPIADKCKPAAEDYFERKESQAGCHLGKPGDGVQIVVEQRFRPTSLSTDQGATRRLSIFLVPAHSLKSPGKKKFVAFFSDGDETLSGKVGCTGRSTGGAVDVKRSNGSLIISADISFTSFSPLSDAECSDFRIVASDVLSVKGLGEDVVVAPKRAIEMHPGQ